MGLDTSHGCWHGAYSAFARFRTELARVAGYPIGPNHMYCNHEQGRCNPAGETYELPWSRYPPGWPQGDWGDMVPEDPLIILLAHSDCDGQIPAKWCLPLAERLEELAPKMNAHPSGHFYDPQGQTLQFAAGLRDAAARGEPVDFH